MHCSASASDRAPRYLGYTAFSGRTGPGGRTGEPTEIEVPLVHEHRRLWLHNSVTRMGDGLVIWIADITERKRVEAELHSVDRRKDEFLATLAHELRNPLAPIRQAAAIASAPRASPAQLRWSQGVVERQVHHMARLLDDLLDVSRVTRGTLELRRELLDIRSVVDAAVETSKPRSMPGATRW